MADNGLDDLYLFYLTNSYHVQASVLRALQMLTSMSG